MLSGRPSRIISYVPGLFFKLLSSFIKCVYPDNPENADAYNNMGNVYKRKGNQDNAIEMYKQAARLGLKEAQKYLNGKGIDWR